MQLPVDDYIRTLTADQASEHQRIQRIVMGLVPSAGQGMSYAMPAYTYQDKALLSCMVNKKFLSIYPFSGRVVEELRDMLQGFDLTTGSIHFTLEHPLPESLIKEIVLARMREIEAKTP